jgi:hypothetical protein
MDCRPFFIETNKKPTKIFKMAPKAVGSSLDHSPHSTFYQTIAVPFEHPVTSLSISPLGTEAVLAAKRGLYFIDLEKPFEEPKILQHLSKWDVADVTWNPHVSRQATQRYNPRNG